MRLLLHPSSWIFAFFASSAVDAFSPSSKRRAGMARIHKSSHTSASASALHAVVDPTTGAAAAAGATKTLLSLGGGAAAAATSSSLLANSAAASSPLLRYFLEQVIASGVPALFSILVIGFAARMIGKARSNNQDDLLVTRNPVAQLYDDLYGDQDQSGGNRPRNPFRPKSNKIQLPRNAGVPSEQFIKMTHLNRQLDSYAYSLKAATSSKAAAAAKYRQASFTRALGKALVVDDNENNGLASASGAPPVRYQELLKAEADFLKHGSEVMADIAHIQTVLTQDVVDKELKAFGMKTAYDLDVAYNATSNETVATLSSSSSNDSKEGGAAAANPAKVNRIEQLSNLSGLQRQMQLLELNFIQKVVQAVGPAAGASVRTALLGDLAVRGSGGLLTALKDRPLRTLLNGNLDNAGDASTHKKPGNLFVTRFPGDATASQVETLREEATAIIRSAKPGVDEVLVVLQTGGGTVTGYGLAAAQLLRFKEAGLKLTIAVEQVAASGGYMMCCVADHIVASPFAVLGSIGVISDIPNVYDRLKQEGIEFQTVTAGKYKRTLTPTKKVTKEDFQKSKEDVEEILVLFRDFVAQNRPQLDIDSVATGETWFGTAALERKLCDEIKTVDDVLMDFVDSGYNVYEVEYQPPIETPFGKIVLGGASAERSDDMTGSWFRRGVRWVVQTIASEIRSELSATAKSGLSTPVEQRYMAKDDTATRIKSD